MKKHTKELTYIEHLSVETLSEEQRSLLRIAKENLRGSYSPYSNFKVSASLLLANGEVISGTNQENIAYPSGLCAERVAMYYAKSKFPTVDIQKIALTASSDQFTVSNPIPPCGACRQAMIEYRLNQNAPIELIMQGAKGVILVIDDLQELLPLHFYETNLRK